MQTGYQQPQQQQQKLVSQPTGFISSLSGTQNNTMNLPEIRLSFISARDQERFEKIFRSQVPAGEISMNSATAKNILMKSNLSAVQLLNIWELADTNKSGSMMFPELCVALHLANLARKGESIPNELPLKIKNEVTGFVDALNFQVGMKSNQNETEQAANNFIQQQQPQGFMQPQQTGYLQPQRTGLTPLAPQQTAGLVPMNTGQLPPTSFGSFSNGLNPQPTGLQPQPTGFFNKLLGQPTGGNPLMAQPTGSLPPTTSFTAQQTGGQFLQPQQTGYLQPMPTGRPGQWGFVNTPTGGLPGLDMMQSHFMPNASTQPSNLQNSFDGKSQGNVTWAITKQEKMIYDNIFKQWDKDHNGFIMGNVAIDVFSKSGLAFADLESIWTLADGGNKGKLNKDEFSVAMHLIYRRLNGFDLPTVLPPELIPPSSKLLESSVDDMKNKLKQQASERAQNQAKHSMNGTNAPASGSSFKNNDDDIQYVSKSRRGSQFTKSKTEDAFSTKLSVDDLKRQIHEKKILLAAIDAEDEEQASDYAQQRSLNEIELLKTKIKSIQSDLNSKLAFANVGSVKEREDLNQKLTSSSDKVPRLVESISLIDEQIKNAKIELFRLQLEKSNPSGFDIRGTGANGEITERDRRIAKQKAEVQAKMAKLTGKPAPNFEAYEHNEAQLSQEILKFSAEAEDQKSMVKDIAFGINELIKDIGSSLNLFNSMTVGYQKWENKDGVQNQEVKDFIDYLNSTKPKPSKTENKSLPSTYEGRVDGSAVAPAVESGHTQKSTGLTPAEERAKKIKEDAQKRMNDRLAKLGIKRKTSTNEVPNVEPTKQEAVQSEPAKPVSAAASVPPPPPPNRASKPAKIEENDDGESDSSDSDDEEYKLLLAKKKAMEERKQKKKLEKEQKLAKLKAEMAALENGDDADDSWDEKEDEKPVAKQEQPQQQPSQPSATTGDHSNNPFASMLGKTEPVKQPVAVPATNGSHNPFSKPPSTAAPLTSTPTGTPIDPSKLQAQRAAQMGGNDNNNDWSDSDDDDAEDEMPVGAKQAELASMLFGGSGAPTRSNTFIPGEKELESAKEEEAPKVEAAQDKESEPVTEQAPAVFPPPVPLGETEAETAPAVFPPPVPVAEAEAAPAVLPPPVPEFPPVPLEDAAEQVVAEVPPPSLPDTLPPPIPGPVLNESNNNSEFFDAESDGFESDDGSGFDQPPPLPETSAPPPPPLPESMPPAAPAGVPPPPPPPPPAVAAVAAPASAPAADVSAAPMPNISNLLGEISLGAKLKRVSPEEQRIADGAVVGHVLD